MFGSLVNVGRGVVRDERLGVVGEAVPVGFAVVGVRSCVNGVVVVVDFDGGDDGEVVRGEFGVGGPLSVGDKIVRDDGDIRGGGGLEIGGWDACVVVGVNRGVVGLGEDVCDEGAAVVIVVGVPHRVVGVKVTCDDVVLAVQEVV